MRRYKIIQKELKPPNGLKLRAYAVRERLKARGLHRYLHAMETVDPGLVEHREEISGWFGPRAVDDGSLWLLERVEAAAKEAERTAPGPPVAAPRPDPQLAARVDQVFLSMSLRRSRQPLRDLCAVSDEITRLAKTVGRWKRGESSPTTIDVALVEELERAAAVLVKTQ